MGQITKKQHYIWRYYLSAWTENNSTRGKISCLRNHKIFETSLMNVAHENYFYLVKDLSPLERKIIYEIAIRKTTGVQREVASGWLDLYCAPYDFAKTLRNSTTMQHLLSDEETSIYEQKKALIVTQCPHQKHSIGKMCLPAA